MKPRRPTPGSGAAPTAALLVLALVPASAASAQQWSPEQREVLAGIERLSASTAPDGAGADAYGEVLAEDFTRWTVGSTEISGKQAWVDGIREWFDEGWRVSDRESRNLEILVRDDFAFVRRLVEETYSGPGGDRSTSTAALAEVWVRGSAGWLLLRASVHPMATG